MSRTNAAKKATGKGISVYPKTLPSGRVRHVVEFNHPDHTRERRSFESVQEARTYADTLTEQLARIGKDGLKIPTTISLSDALDLWFQELQIYADDPRRPEQNRQKIRQYIYKGRSRKKLWQAHSLADRSLRDISQADLCNFIDMRREDDRADSTIRSDLYLLNGLFEHAHAGSTPSGPTGWSWDIESPIMAVCRRRRLQQSRQRDRRPTEQESALILEAFRQMRHGQIAREAADSTKPIVVAIPGHRPLEVMPTPGLKFIGAAYGAAIESAMRRGKLFEMRASWIDWRTGDAVVPSQLRGPANKSVPSRIPLSPALRIILRQVWGTDHRGELLAKSNEELNAPLFGELTADNAYRQLVRVCEHFGIHDLHWHDLRHEACSRLAERGWTTQQIQRVSGHKTLQSLQRYTHISTAAIHALWEREQAQQTQKPQQDAHPEARTSRRNRRPANSTTKKPIFVSFRVAQRKAPQQNHSITTHLKT